MWRFVPVWVLLGGLASLLDAGQGVDAHAASELAYAVCTIVAGSYIFWRHGGPVITAAGLYCLATVVFVGFAGIYYWNMAAPVSDGVYLATVTGYWVMVAMSCMWPRLTIHSRLEVETAPTGWAMVSISGTAVVLALVTTRLSSVSAAVPVQLMLGVLSLLLMAAMLFRTRRPILRGIIVGAPLLWIFFVAVFTGYGRMNMVAMGLAGAVLASVLTLGYRVKAALMLAIAPALVVMVRIREQFGVAEYGSSLNGIGSVVTPLRDFGRLLFAVQSGRIHLGGFDPYVATALFWIPRQMWPGKPVGFGSTLTGILEPQLLSLGQSMAAFNQGEALYAFGWVGVALCVVLTGLYLWLLDAGLTAACRAGALTRRQLVVMFALIMTISDVPNLMWGGVFGHVTRVVIRLAPLILLVPFATSKASTARRHAVGPSEDAQLLGSRAPSTTAEDRRGVARNREDSRA